MQIDNLPPSAVPSRHHSDALSRWPVHDSALSFRSLPFSWGIAHGRGERRNGLPIQRGTASSPATGANRLSQKVKEDLRYACCCFPRDATCEGYLDFRFVMRA